MFVPTFYTLPGNEDFAPRVTHPGEDAGADIKACVDVFNRSDPINFFRKFETEMIKYGVRLYVDGEVFTSESETDFLEVIEQCGGAVYLPPGSTILVNSGFKVSFPWLNSSAWKDTPWEMFLPVYKIVSRSGLSHNHKIVVTNSPGIVDSGYRNWVKVSLTNNSENYHVFTHGSRIAQGICELVIDQSGSKTTTDENDLTSSFRSGSGFGSSGI
jgi:dUTP pyrophosphatase